ncbi:MAG: pyruvate kinase [Gammaproteobacteria bacterium]|nr:pyruvate kinase [Gammaproteobacteria bacterium]
MGALTETRDRKTIFRHTKIIATLGPATDSDEVMEKLIDVGIDLVRLNFSHSTYEDNAWRIKNLRRLSKEKHHEVGVIGDLQGAKIRIGAFRDGQIELNTGESFCIDTNLSLEDGDQTAVGVTYENLARDVNTGDTLLVDDGRIVLEVTEVSQGRIYSEVIMGGELVSSKGVNRKGGGLAAAALTDKDRQDIRDAVKLDIDYLAVSFPCSAEDIRLARELFVEAGGDGGIIAKIERTEALDTIDQILEECDAIMIGRGDLGVEIGDAEVPGLQKLLIDRAHAKNCTAITATQMMESMTYSPIPTRAEVSDVANAVLDGTDAVMLSGETAIGKYPVEAVKAMHRTCMASERRVHNTVSDYRQDMQCGRVDEAIAMSAMYAANHLGVAAIAALTESGSTVLWMSRINSAIPIYALTRHEKTLRRVTLYKGVYPAPMETVSRSHAEVNKDAIDVLLRCRVVYENDLVIITKGDLIGVDGGTNALKIVRVGHLIEPE